MADHHAMGSPRIVVPQNPHAEYRVRFGGDGKVAHFSLVAGYQTCFR